MYLQYVPVAGLPGAFGYIRYPKGRWWGPGREVRKTVWILLCKRAQFCIVGRSRRLLDCFWCFGGVQVGWLWRICQLWGPEGLPPFLLPYFGGGVLCISLGCAERDLASKGDDFFCEEVGSFISGYVAVTGKQCIRVSVSSCKFIMVNLHHTHGVGFVVPLDLEKVKYFVWQWWGIAQLRGSAW